MEIIPAIDLINGQCVRLTEGDFAQQTTYDSDPLAVAQRFEQHGVKRLHLVDLDGARAKRPVNLPVLERIARHTGLVVDYGGGLQSDEALRQAFGAGATQITAGSIAVREPETVNNWLQTFGAEKIIVGADFRDNHISINAWAEQSERTLQEFLGQYLSAGATTFICTDVSKDGKLQGPALDTYRELRQALPAARLIASGGVTTIADVEALAQIGMHGAIIGKAIYEGTIILDELKSWL
ncbi:1-(5-phosphoribosyl)-5-[(5-phosphoribosylamino)methylideneamino]imidazole-4-carboxamide isomerase [Hymenobacter taeanensis]|uniref:1-(5-phosphoribosyl)-5-[(5-phosphoribosylamino)methylideneamino] imidazole-4-carboxamide isomerase n=1 Tax=Hymenobacter taeanensis TaxID=2735321 RepID=A0A6M6BLE2_9BACT|nr:MULTISPECIES: 1-(5-phosphoribosyl)-5-[(5-phosphoribosylamino)methylideneamino]imidazole-4-carboxamide isomerase [Hymenobacter]QJX48634.1 1-(5-phosphoribosyl)-5-[(5-phosphoribosylamino)methylideneamino]imidazole-4-carboxamide isomerase [Hymenobacter taeanensis]UOQ81866.1 1-(5-phosphoribosyl)-5-[(5-phosphoribosylamino)methylideneamino]imidazole-4-carboxamide isomerase [Hymenobacter sp. 5414T-23]